MRIKRERITASGKRELTIELDSRDEYLVAVDTSRYYRLGAQIDDVVRSDALIEARPVYWCHLQQKWEDAR